MAGQVSCDQDQIGDHSPQPSAANGTLVRLLVLQRLLPNHAQQIVSDHRKLKYQSVRIKLAGREALNVHVGFQLAVVLLAFAVSMVGFDDLIPLPLSTLYKGYAHAKFKP